MGKFFKRLKGFFGRVWNGVKTGYGKVKDVVKKVITPLYDKIKPAINLIPGASTVTSVVDKVLPVVNNLSDNPTEALKQGLSYARDRFK